MAFENKTIKEVYDTVVRGFESEFNTQFRLLPKSFVHVTAKVIAGLYITLYKIAAWIFLQIFPDTASNEVIDILGKKINPLVEWGKLIGIGEPNSAVAWSGKASVTVLSDGVINSGLQLKSSLTGKLYLVTEAVIIHKDDEDVCICVECTESGTAGRLSVGDELKFVNPIGFIGEKAFVTEISADGVDAESDESYRHRIVYRWKTQAQGGSLSDYRIWSSEVEGVYQTYIYSDDNSAAGVIIYVCADEASTGSRIANAGLLKAVGEACTYDPDTGEQNRKPVTAVLDPRNDGSYTNIKSVSETVFNVNIKGYTGTVSLVKDSIKTAITNYLKEREPYIRGLSVDNNRLDSITVNNLIGIVNEIAIANTGSFGSVQLICGGADLASYTLGRGELATLGILTINGVQI